MSRGEFRYDVGVIGGGGHVGLPLAMTFADCGMSTFVFDINQKTIDEIQAGQMPFFEHGAPEMLRRVLDKGLLHAATKPDQLSECRSLVCIIGTPVDEHLNPSFTGIHRALQGCAKHLRDGQTLILRSTVYPGMSRHIQRFLKELGLDIKVAFCPERVAQGYSLEEFRKLPQIISAFDRSALDEVKRLFGPFSPEFLEMDPMEAELTKLMTNAWRYIQFATVNQFYMIATKHGMDFNRILHACRHNYPRMQGMPGPGFAAGPCLVKDTMQLAAFSQNTFVLGHSAMLINEGLPAHLVDLARQETDLSEKTVGILGMAFKAENDDHRDSLSYKLKKILTLEAGKVLCTDPYVPDASFVPLERVVAESEVLFVGTPHKAYRELAIPEGKLVIDVWNCLPHRTAEKSST